VTADLVTLWALGLAGALATLLFAVTHRPFFGFIAPALLYLSADELFGLHERLGLWVERQSVAVPGVQDADSLILLAYGVVVSLVAFRHRSVLSAAPGAGRAFAAAFVLGLLAVAMDALVPRDTPGAHGEEYLEAGAAVSLAGIFVAHSLETCRAWMERGSVVLSGDISRVLEDVSNGHALDHEPQRPGNAAR
jgi:hypothetical protein